MCKVLMVMLCVFIAADMFGCTAPPPEGQGSPKALLEKMDSALRSADKKRFVECFVASGKDRQVGGVLFELWQDNKTFYETLEAAYGPAAAKELEEVPASPGIVVSPVNAKWIESVDMNVDGSGAVVRDPWGTSCDLDLVSASGIWYVTLSKVVHNVDDAVRLIQKVSDVLAFGADVIRQSKPPLAELKQRMGERFFYE